MPAKRPARLHRRSAEDTYLRCRTYSHAWDEFAPIDMDSPWYGWRLSLRCIRCGTERHDNIAYSTGEVIGRRYIYPEGYQVHGEDRPTKEVFREELFTKLRSELKNVNALGDKGGGATITSIRKAVAKKRTAAKKDSRGSDTPRQGQRQRQRRGA